MGKRLRGEVDGFIRIEELEGFDSFCLLYFCSDTNLYRLLSFLEQAFDFQS